MVASFRNRVPKKNPRLSGFFVNVLRLRLIQAVGVAIVFFALVQVGRVLTGDAAFNLSQTPLAFLGRHSSSSTYLTEVLTAGSEPILADSKASQNKPGDTYGMKEKQQPSQEERTIVTGSAI